MFGGKAVEYAGGAHKPWKEVGCMRGSGWLALVVVAAVVVAGCGGGVTNGGPVGGIFDSTAWEGTWVGQWTNTTFSSTGPATIAIAEGLVAGTADVNFDMDGAVFGQADPPAVQMTVAYDDTGIDAQVNGTQLGDLAFTIDANDNVQGSFTNVPGGGIARVDFTGQRNGNTITINYTVTFAGGGGTAAGNLVVTKQ